MKKIFFLTLCTVVLLSCSPKRPSVIERPVFEVWNSTTLEIDKIEMSDSATIFYIDAYYLPKKQISIHKGTYIRKSGSNEKLLVTCAEGINLDEETMMPESGTLSFKLFFPPLKPGITQIDLIESDCPDCFKIWGIHLLPNAKIKFDPVPKDVAKTSTEPLPVPEYSIQPARVSGRLLGYGKGMEHSSITITAFNILYFKQLEAALPIAEDGSFSGEIIPGFPSIYKSSAGSLFLAPGKETKLYVDLKKRTRYQSRYRTDKEPGDSIYTYLSGGFTSSELETINQVSGIIRALPDLSDRQKMLQEIVNMNPEEFKQYILSLMNKRLEEINQKGYSPNMRMMMENAIRLEVYVFMMQYEGYIATAKMEANKPFINTIDEREKIYSSIEKPGAEFYSFLKEALNDNMSYLPLFGALANMLSGDYIRFFYIPDWKNQPAKERFAYVKNKITPIVGTDKGILLDVIHAQCYGYTLVDMKFFTDAEKQEIRDAFSDKPVYAESLIAESDRLEMIITATKEKKESVMNESPDVSQELMLDAILAGYKNKVVVIDFWGTWCAPCMVALKTIQPLKDEMKEKDVVWVYVADETSPLDTWKQTCPGISGEHYYVSRAQASYWGIQSYPTYRVYDRNGKQLAQYIDFPGVVEMKKAIEKGL